MSDFDDEDQETMSDLCEMLRDKDTEIARLRAQVEDKNAALAKAEKWFTEYAEMHDAKGNRDKAIRNMDRAMTMHAAIAATGSIEKA